MKDPFFFGYGSLVNRTTHDYPHPARATVRGWVRVWRGTHLRRVAFLTAVPSPGDEIEGLIAAVPGSDWTALDIRERAYRRQAVADISHAHDAALEVHIYEVEAHHVAETQEHPILLSYLDTVIQGYLREFGEAGAQRFFDTTSGWGHTVLDDRAAPVYSRVQEVTRQERAFVDKSLNRLGVSVNTATANSHI